MSSPVPDTGTSPATTPVTSQAPSPVTGPVTSPVFPPLPGTATGGPPDGAARSGPALAGRTRPGEVQPGEGQPAPAAQAARQALTCAWHLAVLEGPDAGLVLPVPRSTVVGRGAVLSDPLVSRRHLRVRARGARIHAQDMGSANGSRRRLACGLWWPLRGERRLREGTRLRLGDSVLELRRRPDCLVVPAPAGPGPTGWALTSVLYLLVAAAVAVMAVTAVVSTSTGAPRTGHRGTLGLLAVAPMLVMAMLRAAPALQSLHRGGADPRRPGAQQPSRRPGRPGWRRRRPDPPSMLLALAARSWRSGPQRAQTSQATQVASPPLATGPDQGPLAWTGRMSRRQVLGLGAGDHLALTGPHAQACLRWWCAQVLAQGQAQVRLRGPGALVTWGPADRRASACVVACPSGAVPPQALGVTAAPAGAPHAAAAWWHAACVLGGAVPQDDPGDRGGVPDSVTLRDILTPTDTDGLREAWTHHEQARGPQESQGSRGSHGSQQPGTGAPRLSAVLGVGRLGAVRADLVSHGPHALLAGTTGSGKSELLVSWLLQLALGSSPSRLALVLVDYKGGAAFGALASLPHTVGVLTDLDPAGTHRALSSLQAEVRRRERLLLSHAAKDLGSLPAHVRLPRLVIAVDEFATLAAEHADVLEALVRVAAQGRSLGIHLILATQRPQGAVSPSIRANTALRVCLRVLDPADSRDVLGHEGAAHLPHHPGRVIVSGAGQAPEGPEVLQAPWCGSEKQVRAVVDLVRNAAQGLGTTWRPWAQPLPERVYRDQAVALVSRQSGPTDEEPPGLRRPGEEGSPGAPGILLGLTDLPESQRLGVWTWDTRHTLLVVGSPGSGRTTTVLSAAEGALAAGTAVHLCTSLPPGSSRLPLLAGGRETGAGIGTVAGPDDPRRLARLWTLAASGSLGDSLLCLDDVDALVPAVSEALGPGEGHSLLESLMRTSSGAGTRLVVSAPLSWASSRWAGAARLRLVLGASRLDQASQAGLPRGVVTGSCPGRGVLLDRDTATACQVVLPARVGEIRGHGGEHRAGEHGAGHGERHTGRHSGGHTGRHAGRQDGSRPGRGGGGAERLHPPLRLEPLPRYVPAGSLPSGTWALGGDAASPVPVPGTSVLVVGPPGSGRSTALAAIRRASRQEDVMVCDDLDLACPSSLTTVEAALEQGRTVLASATTERAASTYRGALAVLRERGALVVLWPGAGPAHQVAGVALRAATDPRALSLPGRGVLVHRGVGVPVQVAAPPERRAGED